MESNKPKIAILGFGKEGKSALKFIKKYNPFPRSEIWILDQNPDLEIPAQYLGLKLHKELGKDYLSNLGQFSAVIRSPGVPFNLPEIQKAVREKITVTSPTKLFFERSRVKIIGVTGSKGKSTTSHLIWKILAKSGFRALLGGNIGTPELDLLPEAASADFVVLELSSFQLQDLDRSPDIAVVLDIFPEHLDAHKSLLEYITAKAVIARFQKKSDTIFCFADNQPSKAVAEESPGKRVLVNSARGGVRKNLDMAEAVARFLRCPEEVIQKVLESFKGLEHRLEFVRAVKMRGGAISEKGTANVRPTGKHREHHMLFYNDSAATNPQAAALAIGTLDPDCNLLILIGGGKDKNLDYKPLADALKKSKHAAIAILFGENKELIKKQLTGTVINLETADTLAAAVKMAYEAGKKFVLEKENEAKAMSKSIKPLTIAIVLSPASASFDMFQNLYERGKTFKKLVQKLR